MLNVVSLNGRLTKSPEVKKTTSGFSRLAFSLAVPRPWHSGQQQETDFVPCVAWRTTADFVARNFKRGQTMALRGHLSVRSYQDDEGVRHSIMEVVADEVSFVGSRPQQETPQKETIPEDTLPYEEVVS